MKKQYIQLTLKEREEIQRLRWQKRSLRDIAHELRRNVSTISRELARHRTGNNHYHARLAHERTQAMIRKRGERPRLKKSAIRSYVMAKLKKGWSPEQIAGRWKRRNPQQPVSHEAIYQYVYARVSKGTNLVYEHQEDLRKYLRRAHKRRQRRGGIYQKRSLIPNRIGIEERPRYIERRKQPGHWEGDSLVSRKSLVALNTLVERASGLVKITKIPNLRPVATAQAVNGRLRPLPEKLRRTLTMDNGIENAGHEQITAGVGTRCYFAHAYRSCERGTNENTNGLIRWYLPKGTDFAIVTDKVIATVERSLNTRPRKRLRYQTPLEVFTSVALKG